MVEAPDARTSSQTETNLADDLHENTDFEWPTIGRFGTGLILVLGVVLAWAGVQEGVDSIVHYVFTIVDQVPSDPISLLKPVWNPEPMYTRAYRPLSTALVKLGSAIFGRDPSGLQWFTFAHGLFLIGYGLSARRFLRVHEFGDRIALLGAVTSMLTPTVLFSAWTIPEFDMVGGIFVLLAAAELRKGHWKRSIPLALMALITKETSALLMLAYLMAFSLHRIRENRRYWFYVLGYLAVLMLAVFPIFLATPDPQAVTEYNLSGQGFQWIRVLHLSFLNVSQIFYVLGPAGALLWLYLACEKQWGWALFVGGLGLFTLTPLLRHYNHYESIAFSHWIWVIFWVVVALIATVRLIWKGSPNHRLLMWTILLGAGGLLAGPVLASFSRADLSARLYAPLIPMMHGLAWAGAAVVWHQRHRLWKPVGLAVVVCFAWQPVAGAISSWQFNRARFPVEVKAKQYLVTKLARSQRDCQVLVFCNNRDQEVAKEELPLLGSPDPNVVECTRLMPLEVVELGSGDLWSYEDPLFSADQSRALVDSQEVEGALKSGSTLPHTVHLFAQTARSTMGPEVNAALIHDFDWAVKRMPEVDKGYIQQAVGMVYVKDTPLERMFEQVTSPSRKKQYRLPYFQLPLWLHELPSRLIRGVPLVENYRYQITTYTLYKGEKPRTRR